MPEIAVCDLDIMKALLGRAGIPFQELRRQHAYDGTAQLPATWALRVDAGAPLTGSSWDAPDPEYRRVVFGYTFFYTEFYFDRHGALLNMGAYE